MKKLIFSLLTLTFLFNCSQNNSDGYTINVNADGIPDGSKVTLRKFENRKPVDVDSAKVENGKFTLSGKIDSPDVYFLFIDRAMGNFPFILENKELNLTVYKDSMPASKVEGSKENDLAQAYMKGMKEISKEGNELRKQYSEARKNNDSTFLASYQDMRKELTDKSDNFAKGFVTDNTNSVFGMILLENFYATNKFSFNEAQDIYNSFSEEAKNSAAGQRIKERIDAELATAEGSVAPDFTAKNPEGKDISLNDIKGKITIVDFWAAWCRPCRMENPNMVKLYEKYHDKGLEIIGVSLDGNPRQKDARQEWVDAIEKDGLTWYQVSNLNYFNGPIAQKYNIKSIPATFILDSEGKIIAKNLRGEAMQAKIAELLD